MNDAIQRGAYLLRLWDTERVATSSSASPTDTGYIDVKTENKDEATTRERQIWWIERVPGDEENDEHSFRQKYTITHCGSERGLVRRGNKASVSRMHGKPEEHWNFVPRFPDHPQFRAYSIQGNSDVFQLTASSAEKTVTLTLQEEAFPRTLQRWELILPTPSIPTGWFRIRNTTTNATLAHRFTHIPPFLIPDDAYQMVAPCDMNCCSGERDKATQWALAHSQLHVRSFLTENPTSNRYLLRNRLTGGFLADKGEPGGLTQICCWSKPETQWIESSFADNTIWEVQAVAPPYIWEFRNRATRRVLAETASSQYVNCVDRLDATSAQWRVDPLDGHPHVGTPDDELPAYF